MNTLMTRLATLACAAGVAVTSAACSHDIGGTPVAPPSAQAAFATGELLDTNLLTPGIQVRIGEGDDARVCTAGWLMGDAAKTLMFVTAGQCAAEADDPVEFSYVEVSPGGAKKPARTVALGKVIETTYQLPYHPSQPNFAMVKVSVNDDTRRIKAAPSPAGQVDVSVMPVVRDVEKWFDTNDDHTVCWYYSVGEVYTEENAAQRVCGTATGVVNKTKIAVKVDDDFTWDPSSVGAPAVWSKSKHLQIPLGIVTDFTDGSVLVDSPIKALSDGGVEILKK